jgi:hypothetical protein
MARLTVSDIMTQVASSVNQEAIAPEISSSEFTLWLSYMNRAFFEYAESNDWENFRKPYYTSSVEGATVSLPLDFHKLANPPRYFGTGVVDGEEWPEGLQEEKGLHVPTDKYFEIFGNPSDGYYLLWNPATLASGATIYLEYFSMPTALANINDVPNIPDPQYLTDRVTGFIFEARSDARFQTQEQKAREKLLQMIENANLAKYSSFANPNYVGSTLRRAGFRMGRD